MDFYAVSMQTGEVLLLQWLVIGIVAESVENSSYLYAFLAFLPEEVEEKGGDGVVSEIEILQMDTLLCLTDVFKQSGEFFSARHQQFNVVVL